MSGGVPAETCVPMSSSNVPVPTKLIVIPLASANSLSAVTVASPSGLPEVSTLRIDTSVPARSAPSMPLSPPLPAPAPAPPSAGALPVASVPAGSVPAAAVSSGVVVSVPALATLAAPSTPTIASGTNSDLTRERERMCSPLSPATSGRRFSQWLSAGEIRLRHNARPGATGQAEPFPRVRRHATSILRLAPGERANG